MNGCEEEALQTRRGDLILLPVCHLPNQHQCAAPPDTNYDRDSTNTRECHMKQRRTYWIALAGLLVCLTFIQPCDATLAAPQEMHNVCENYIRLTAKEAGWNDSQAPAIRV